MMAKWEKHEVYIIENNPSATPSKLAPLLPGRSLSSIACKQHAIFNRKYAKDQARNGSWSGLDAEIAIKWKWAFSLISTKGVRCSA